MVRILNLLFPLLSKKYIGLCVGKFKGNNEVQTFEQFKLINNYNSWY